MRLMIMRHGQALSKAQDPERGLSAEGRRQVQEVARRLASLDWRPERILHSPKARARQTAEILAEVLGRPGVAEEVMGLKPEDPVGLWLERLGAEEQDLALVSHLPFVDILSRSLLLAGSESVDGFDTAGVALFERSAVGLWRLVEQL